MVDSRVGKSADVMEFSAATAPSRLDQSCAGSRDAVLSLSGFVILSLARVRRERLPSL
jgi:hypothetical protein